MRAADQVRLSPWFTPSAPALAALATSRQPWNESLVRHDPGAIALLLRFQKSNDRPLCELNHAERAEMLRFAWKRLRGRPAQVSLDTDAHRTTLRIAELASRLIDDESQFKVHIVALMTLIGDQAARITRRWGLPKWCVAALSALNHDASVAESLGADRRIVAGIRAAAWLIEPTMFHALDAHALQDFDAATARQMADEIPIPVLPPFENPHESQLLPDLLRLAERNFSRDQGEFVEALEAEVGALHRTLADRQHTESERLHNRKMAAIAEFAAGAGHEINTPLAIISGQAQLLLQNECDADRRKSLDAIVQQTRRVHDLLTDLMQFARPAKPSPHIFDLGVILHEIIEVFRGNAAERGIDLQLEPCSVVVHADPRQTRTALLSLFRNAFEATPDLGWVRIDVEETMHQVRIAIEDSGPGPDPAIIDHLFDPFFSGRTAGRGRGLGLPTAWRLAQEQGGDVRYERLENGPTRFVMTLPRATALPTPERMSA